ncbi:MAG: mannosyltransferase [Clostridia bacterium]|nr:mannosyltransferase [Clostridia bacterium]
MIPKIIHACWLGKAEMPQDQKEYVEEWKKLHPDYEIKIWTDETFNEYLNDSLFVKDCIKTKKYGFLSDYFRFVVLYKFGGIYIDTDVELFKKLDDFLDCKMFMGYLVDSSIGTALIGSEQGNPLMKEFLEILQSDYEKKGAFTVSNHWITKYFIDNFEDFRLSGKRQSLKCGIEIYPKDYFERYQINKKSGGGYAEHHCYGSWRDDKSVPLYIRILKKILPRGVVSWLGHIRENRKTPYYSVYLKDKKRKV